MSKPREVSAGWRSILLGIPGYDPFITAAEGDWFDPKAGQLAIDFFAECLHHIEGEKAGHLFKLEPWQQAIIGNLFGWKRRDEFGREVRRYREAFIFTPRKQGKTPLAAGIGLFVLLCDGEAGAQIYCAAGERDQAALIYRHAKGMVERDADISERCRVYAGTGHKSIVLRSDEASSLKVLSADADTKHGGNTHAVLIDELHVQPNRELVDVLQTSMASANRKQPLMVSITTAGWDRNSICFEKYTYAKRVRDREPGFEDSRFLPVIYEAPADADWLDEKTWAIANPNLGVSVSLSYLQREAEKAKSNPAYENTFKRLHLNIWTEQDIRWIPMDQWDACSGTVGLDELAGQPCFGGLDLGATQDLNALVLAFPRADGKVALRAKFWAPRAGAERRQRKDHVPYLTWAQQGWLTLTDGDTADYDAIRADVVETCSQYEVRELAVDRLFQGVQICTDLQRDGLPVVAHGQGFLGMAQPTKEFERLLFGGLLLHGGNPVLRWMAGNVVAEQDAAGNIKASKRKSSEKIDGIVAAIMAVGRMSCGKRASVYEDRGVFVLGE